ncbi:MAG TPA: zinc ribbon domain-containing protein [Treponema sp.]|nr:zinc ribbon domain-containing protein [Treponema sp.]HRS03499.1 zinc ribbon domain-containing protein [Treponema sp.]HRU29839.1 zinc ribbon domain-containing protein [Treponema sp.]
MPTYEYECKTCGHSFEVFQNMSDPVLKTCPECGKEVRRLINGGTGIIFKGSGFYVTDKGSSKSSSGSSACSTCSSSDSGTCASKTAV